MNYLSTLPNELIVKITQDFDSETKRTVSLLDQIIRAKVLNTIKCIKVFPSSSESRLNLPEDILVRVISRYSNLQKIIFGKKSRKADAFGDNEEPYLKALLSHIESNKALLSHIESNPDKHFLSSVKKIRFRQIDIQRQKNNLTKTKEFNKSFLRAICHNGLEKLTIKDCLSEPILTGYEIQPILNLLPKLTNFIFKSFWRNEICSLSFANQLLLSKVKLLFVKMSYSILESIKNCSELKELAIDCTEPSGNEFKEMLLNASWKLTHLNVKKMSLKSDVELDTLTKKLPNLEHFSIKLKAISDIGMAQFGLNCPQLKNLKIISDTLTNSQLNHLTKSLPFLRMLYLKNTHNISGGGIIAVAQNCKSLLALRVHQYQLIGELAINALRDNCKDLIALELRNGNPPFINYEALNCLVEHRPSLRYVDIYDDDMSYLCLGKRSQFFQKYPHISRIPRRTKLPKLVL